MKKAVVFLSCLVGLSFSGLAAATSVPQTAPLSQSAATATVSKNDLAKFAKASQELKQIQQKYMQQLQGTQSKKVAKDVQKKAYEEMTKAIENNGLTTKQYNQIAKKVQQSRQLQEKFQKIVQ